MVSISLQEAMDVTYLQLEAHVVGQRATQKNRETLRLGDGLLREVDQ